jgi:hypothetical protein
VCPVAAPGNIVGIGIFNADEDTVRSLMKEDPAIREGVFSYDVLPVRSFPGDSLPS